MLKICFALLVMLVGCHKPSICRHEFTNDAIKNQNLYFDIDQSGTVTVADGGLWLKLCRSK